MVADETRKAGPLNCNGATVTFNFEFKVFDEDEVVVTLADNDGVEATLDYPADFSVTLNPDQNSDPGGSITTDEAYASGYTITITSGVEYVQPTHLTSGGGFYPHVVEDALDRATILAQQNREVLSRAVTTAVSDSGAIAPLPTAAIRANGLLGFDANGDPVIVQDAGTSAEDAELAAAAAAASALQAAAYAGALTGNFTDERFVDTVDFDTGVDTQLTLANDYGSETNITVFIDTTYKPPTSYTLSGTTLTFGSAIVGTNVYVKGGKVLPLAAPADASVTAAKLSPSLITGLDDLTALAVGDSLMVSDVSASGLREVLVSDFLKITNSLNADASPDPDADYVMTYDTSASAAKKALLKHLGITQIQGGTYSTYSSTTAAIPVDNTIPQNGEGLQIITVAITPKRAGSTLLVVATVPCFNASGSSVLALFQDSTVNALAAEANDAVGPASPFLMHAVAAANTSPTTFKLRVGPNSGTLYLNGNSGGRLLGGVQAARMIVLEVM